MTQFAAQHQPKLSTFDQEDRSRNTKYTRNQGLHLIAILPDHEFRFSRANDHDLIRLE